MLLLDFLGFLLLFATIYVLIIIGRMLYTGYSFMRSMGIRPKFTRKGPKFKTDFDRTYNQETQRKASAYNTRSGNAHHEGEKKAAPGGKIFSKNEGEYVDFEEV